MMRKFFILFFAACFVSVSDSVAEVQAQVRALRQQIAFDAADNDDRQNPFDSNNKINSKRLWFAGQYDDFATPKACAIEIVSLHEAFLINEKWKGTNYFVVNFWESSSLLDGIQAPTYKRVLFLKGYESRPPIVLKTNQLIIVNETKFQYDINYSKISPLPYNLKKVSGLHMGEQFECGKLRFVGSMDQERWENLGDLLIQFQIQEMKDDSRVGVVFPEQCAPALDFYLGQNFPLYCWMPAQQGSNPSGFAVRLSQKKTEWQVTSSCRMSSGTNLLGILKNQPVCY